MAAAKKEPLPHTVGARCKATKRDESIVPGVIAGIDPGKKGVWIAVNTAKKGQTPQITKFPASKVRVLPAAAA